MFPSKTNTTPLAKQPTIQRTPNLDSQLLVDSPYKEALLQDPDTSTKEDSPLSTFLLHKSLISGPSISDDVTIDHTNANPVGEFTNSVRMAMVFKLPPQEDGCST